MNSFTRKLIPVALIGMMTSSMMSPYIITSVQGGPISDEIGGVLSFAETELNNKMKFQAAVKSVTHTDHSSLWLTSTGEDRFPKGSKAAVVEFTITNNSDEDVDVFGMFIKAWFGDSQNLASPVLPVKKAEHVKQGYPEYIVDLFSTDSWVIKPGKSLTFADTFYVEEDNMLHLTVTIPQANSQAVSETFTLPC
jgi:hypothetical protein